MVEFIRNHLGNGLDHENLEAYMALLEEARKDEMLRTCPGRQAEEKERC